MDQQLASSKETKTDYEKIQALLDDPKLISSKSTVAQIVLEKYSKDFQYINSAYQILMTSEDSQLVYHRGNGLKTIGYYHLFFSPESNPWYREQEG